MTARRLDREGTGKAGQINKQSGAACPNPVPLAARLCGFVIILTVLITCSRASREPERIVEKGVEVVINGAEPYLVEGEPRSLVSREEFRIDLEEEMFSIAGLSDVSSIDVDSSGRIYVFRRGLGPGHQIFRFDDRGKFQTSFLSYGKGPGEFEFPHFLPMTAEDEIPVVDHDSRKIVDLDLEGRIVRTSSLPADMLLNGRLFYRRLANGYYLDRHFLVDGSTSKIDGVSFSLLDKEFRPVRDLEKASLPSRPEDWGLPFLDAPVSAVSDRQIFIGSFRGGRDIKVFDLEGTLVRKIRLDYPTSEIPAAFREAFPASLPASFPVPKKIEFPAMFPHYQALFADDSGRLFAATYDRDGVAGANVCDVFTAAGVRILRTPIGFQEYSSTLSTGKPLDVIVKKGRAYCVREKDNGFQEIVVYSLAWR